MKRWLIIAFAGLLAVACWAAQQASPPPPTKTPQTAVTDPEFLHAADEVLAEMSQLLDLPVKTPLKKSLRTREEIRAHLVQEMEEDKKADERYADQRAAEAFGLIPKNFPLDSFLLDLLTEQVAGLYDPKAKEFYIADWIPIDEQRDVMAHELTHALDDQYFNIDPWLKAARPNDDAETARDAVLEGSALAAMVDYALRDQHMNLRALPDVSGLLRGMMPNDPAKYPVFEKAPPFIKDELLFPYLAGTSFTQQFLKANSGWSDFRRVFDDPPVSTQQILHPELYLSGTRPVAVTMPDTSRLIPRGWKKLEENVLGEFGLQSVLKQFLDKDRAGKISPEWAGDRYVVFENKKSKQTLLLFRLQLDTVDDTALFFGQFSELLELKHATRSQLFRRPNFFQFQTPEGGVFLRCSGVQCLVVEGADRRVFDGLNRAIGWPRAPAPTAPAQKSTALAAAAF